MTLTPAEKQSAYRERLKQEQSLHIALEAYVGRELAISRAQGCNLERTQSYARWRWAGVQDGTIASL